MSVKKKSRYHCITPQCDALFGLALTSFGVLFVEISDKYKEDNMILNEFPFCLTSLFVLPRNCFSVCFSL